MSVEDQILLARLEEKYNNLIKDYIELKSSYKAIYEDILGKAEELVELNLELKLLEKDFKKNLQLLEKDLFALKEDFISHKANEKAHKEQLNIRIKDLHSENTKTFWLYGKLFMYFCSGIIATISTFISLGLIKF